MPLSLFRREISTVLGFVRNGLCVNLSDIGGGRNEVLRASADQLEKEARDVIRLKGAACLAHEPLAAFKLSEVWRLPGFTENATLSQIILRLSDIILSRPRTVIAVENFDLLDSESRAVLEVLRARTNVVMLASSRRSIGTGGQPLALAGIAWPCAEVLVESLSFEYVNILVEKMLEGPVEWGLVNRIYVATQGRFDFVKFLVDNAQRSQLLVKREGRWSAPERLWNHFLEGYLSVYLAGFPLELRGALEVLALAGAAEIELCVKLLSAETLSSLEVNGLITLLPQENTSLVEVVPPIISDYYAKRVTPIRRRQIDEMLGNATTVARAGSRPSAKIQRGTAGSEWRPISDVLQSSRLAAAFSRLEQDRWQPEAEALRAQWEVDLSARSATCYLRHLLRFEYNPDVISDVLERTTSDDEDAENLLQLGLIRLELAFLEQRDDSVRLSIKNELCGAFPEQALYIVGEYEFLETFFVQSAQEPSAIQADIHQKFQIVPLVARDFRAIVLGKRTISEASGRVIVDEGEWQELYAATQRVSDLAASWDLFVSGSIVEAAELSLEKLDKAISTLDYNAIIGQAHLAAFGLYHMGRLDDVEVVLDCVFAFDAPGFALKPLYQSLLRLGALVAARKGRSASARRYLDHAAGMTGPGAAMPGAQEALSVALSELLSGHHSRAIAAFMTGVEECLRRGWNLAAVHLAIDCLVLCKGEQAHARVSESGIRDRLDAQLVIILDLHLAIAIDDTDQITTIAERLAQTGHPYFASLAYGYLDDRSVEEGDLERASAFHDRRRALPVHTDSALFVSVVENKEPTLVLTARETEIALLAAQMPTQEIARVLSVSVRTVENHIHRAMRKSNTSTRHDLTAWARR